MRLLDFYRRAPLPAKRLAVAVKGAKEHLLRYGATYRDALAMLPQSERWSIAERERYQSELLHTLLSEASQHTDYYPATLTADAMEHAVRTLDLSSLPVLDKADYKAHRDAFLNRLRRTVVRGSTSGSTGSPLRYEYDRETLQQRYAFMHRHRQWAGARPLGTSVRFSGHHMVSTRRSRPPYWIYNPADRQLLLSTYHLHESNLGHMLDKLVSLQPQIIDGYPSAIVVLARYAMREARPVAGLRGVITTAENLEPSDRKEIEDGLGAPVLDYYAASEGVPFIQQCVYGRYHMRPESGMFEILDDEDRPVGPGETGELIATSFAQWRMPQIRYRTGDLLTTSPEDEPCPCGCTHSTVEAIVGRQEDRIITKDGRTIGMVNYRLLKTLEGVLEAQIEQTAADAFTLRVVLDREGREEHVGEVFRRKLRDLLGHDAEVRIQAVPRLPRGPNGKLRAVIRSYRPGCDAARSESTA